MKKSLQIFECHLKENINIKIPPRSNVRSKRSIKIIKITYVLNVENVPSIVQKI